MKVLGWTIRSMGMEYIPGQMVENIKETIKMIRSMEQEHIHGQMAESM